MNQSPGKSRNSIPAAFAIAAIWLWPFTSVAIELEICGYGPGNPIGEGFSDAEDMQFFSVNRTRLDSMELVVGDLAPAPGQPWPNGGQEIPPIPTASATILLALAGIGPFDPDQSTLTISGDWLLADEAFGDFFGIGGQSFDTFGLCEGNASNCSFEVEIEDVSDFLEGGDKLGVTFDYFDGDNENDMGFPADVPLRLTRFDLDFVALPPSTVQGVQLFLNNSAFDGNGAAVDSSDFAAIAVDTSPLRLGETATLANISGYSRGVNGLFIDFDDLPADGANLDADDLAFTVGNDDSREDWIAAPQPTEVGVLINQGDGGADRVYVAFADGAISDTWLHVNVKANLNTGLAADESYFFGAAPGETGATFSPTLVGVDAADLQSVAADITPLADAGTEPISKPSDLNRDRTINAFDLQVVATNLDFNVINFITPQAAAATSAASAVPEPAAGTLLAVAVFLAVVVRASCDRRRSS